MNEREINVLDALVKVREFDSVNSNDYQQFTEAATHFGIVREAIDVLESESAAQTSGARGRAVEQKSVVKAAIRRKMKDISRTARALNIADEGFRRLFTLPNDSGEQKLLAAAREFVAQATKFKADFLRLAMPADFIEDLTDDIETLEAAASAKAGAQTRSVSSSAAIDAQIERVMDSLTVLDAIMHNVYRNNPAKLAQWTQARHIKRSGKKAKSDEIKS